MTRPAKNIPASVRQRLQDHARKANRPFQEVLELACPRILVQEL